MENASLQTARHFVLQNIKVRNVNGAYAKETGAGAGIRFNAVGLGDRKGLGRRFDSILIESCHIKDCSRNGIVVNGGALRENWNPSTRVVIRRNLIEGVGGDGILPTSCQGPLVEWNTMRDCPAYGEEGGAAAGMWPWSCDDAVFQFNEVVGHKAWIDGQAYDSDYNCNNTIFQYNLSRDNEGGFMLICSPGIKKRGWLKENAWNRGTIIRHNLSINDGLRTIGHKPYHSPVFWITGESTQDTEIYGNLVIVPKKPDPKMDSTLIHFDKWGGKYPVDTLFRDNVFIAGVGQPGTFDFGRAKAVRFENNLFYGEIAVIEETAEVKTNGNQSLRTQPSEVTIAGTQKQLSLFARFLEAKGNPHETHGITIRGEIR